MNDVLVVVTCGQWAAPTRDTIPVCAGVSACRRIIGLVSTTNLQAFAKTACEDRARSWRHPRPNGFLGQGKFATLKRSNCSWQLKRLLGLVA